MDQGVTYSELISFLNGSLIIRLKYITRIRLIKMTSDIETGPKFLWAEVEIRHFDVKLRIKSIEVYSGDYEHRKSVLKNN